MLEQNVYLFDSKVKCVGKVAFPSPYLKGNNQKLLHKIKQTFSQASLAISDIKIYKDYATKLAHKSSIGKKWNCFTNNLKCI